MTKYKKELTIISGKGGTGKTTLAAAFASLAERAVIADCDVDAANLHLILRPEIIEEHAYEGGFTAEIDTERCTLCGQCQSLCRFSAISDDMRIDPLLCEGCGVCMDRCPENAIRMKREICGQWFLSNTRFGPFVHARLGIAQDNSGKLVSQVRRRANEIAEEQDLELVLVDGAPGIGCPVISSVAGTDLVLAVTEPTQSGRHDLERVLELARHFKIKTAVCVNKSDLNEDMTAKIKTVCREKGAIFAGTIPYDPAVTEAMVAQKSLVENGESPGAVAIKNIWRTVLKILQ